MKIYYDAQVDALYIEFHSLAEGSAQTKEFSEDIIANYGPDGKIAGIEVLDASSVLGEELQKLTFEITPMIHKEAS